MLAMSDAELADELRRMPEAARLALMAAMQAAVTRDIDAALTLIGAAQMLSDSAVLDDVCEMIEVLAERVDERFHQPAKGRA